MKKILLILFLVAGIVKNSGAQIIKYKVSSLSGITAGSVTGSNASTGVDASSSALSRGSGLTPISATGAYNSKGWDESSLSYPDNGDDYYSIIITPSSNYQITISQFSVALQRSTTTGPTSAVLRSSVDGFSSTLYTFSSIDDVNPSDYNASISTINNQTSAIEFRIYAAAGNTTGSLKIVNSNTDGVYIYGTVTSTNSITTSTVSPTSFNFPDCSTTLTGTVDFTSTGTFNSDNIYTAQLSNSSGSFSNAKTIGTLTSFANSGTISFSISSPIAPGSGYKIRVISSSPSAVGSSSSSITVTSSCYSSNTNYFRSKNSTGEWSNESDWESSTSSSGPWQTSTLSPDQLSSGITIQSGHNMYISSGSVTADQMTISSGGTFTLDAGSFTLNDGSGTDLKVDGTFTQSSASGTYTQNGTITFNTGSTYNHARSGGTIPSATWTADIANPTNGATCKVTGYTFGSITNFGQNYANFQWNCPNQISDYNNTSLTFKTQSTLTVTSTGANAFSIYTTTASSTTAQSFTFGSISVTGGTLNLCTSSNTNLGIIIATVSGNVSVSNSGIFNLADGTASPPNGSYRSILHIAGDLTLTGNSQFFCGSSTYRSFVLLNKNGTQVATLSSINSPSRLDFAVASISKLTLASNFNLSTSISDFISVAGGIDAANYTIGNSSNTTFYMGGNTSVSAVPTITGSITSGSNIITGLNINPSSYLYAGMSISGVNIPTSSYVIGYTSSTITISKVATSSGTVSSTSFLGKGAFTTSNTNGLNSSGTSGAVQTYASVFSSYCNYTFNGTSQSTGYFTTTPTANTVNILEIAGTVTNNYGATLNANNLKLTSGTFTVGAANTINVLSAGKIDFTGGGVLASGSGAGTISFPGAASISGNANFYNFSLSGAVVLNSSSLSSTTVTISGSISGAGTFSGSSLSNLVISGSGSSAGTLSFTSGSQTLRSLTMNRTGISNGPAAVLGTNLSVDSLVLKYGVLATGSSLLTYTNSKGYTAPSNYNDSWICTCLSNGSQPSFTSPYDGTLGFKISNTVQNADNFFPVGADYTSPNRMYIRNTDATSDNYAVLVTKETLESTNNPAVNRIWYVKNTSSSAKADVKLYFTKKDWSTYSYPSQEDEVETGFDYLNVILVQKDYGSNNYFINVASGSDIKNFIGSSYESEIYAQYSAGVSADYGGNTNGVNNFNRFSVTNGFNILPVKVYNFKAFADGNKVKLNWQATDESDVNSYTIERSTGLQRNIFTSIGSVSVTGNNTNAASYSFTDNDPQNGINYYRIKVTEKSGAVFYTNTQQINFTGRSSAVQILPNPVRKNIIPQLQFADMAAGTYTVTVFNMNGQLVSRQFIGHNGGNKSYILQLPLSTVAGTYPATITDNKGYNLKTVLQVQ